MKPNHIYDLFISFADEDKAFAVRIYEVLISKGLKVWCSAKDVPIGSDIHAGVSNALPLCKYFLPIISPHYGRFWHEKEFHSGCHNRHNQFIIPLAYGTDYEHINNKPMFSLISSIRTVKIDDDNMSQICESITARIKEQPKPQNYILAKTIFSEKIIHNRIIQIIVATSLFSFSGMRIYDYISERELNKASTQSEMSVQTQLASLTDTLKLVGKSTLPTNENAQVIQLKNLQDKDRFALKIKNVVAKKQKNGLQNIYFTIANQSDKSLFFNTLILDVTRTRSDVDLAEKSIDIETIGIWEVEIPTDSENTRYKYKTTKAPKKLVAQGQTVELCLILYQIDNKKRMPPPPFTLRATFVSSEKMEVSSKDFYFNKNGEFVYDE
jgi:hypothetical protein